MSNKIWVESSSEQGRSWSRVLGDDEAAFHWDGELDGTCDITMDHHVTLDYRHRSMLSDQSKVEQAWIDVKRRHPLLASSVVEASPTDLRFNVNERDVCSIRKGEIELLEIDNVADYQKISDDFANGPRKLSRSLLACVVIISVPSPNTRSSAGNQDLHYHVVICNAHVISDAMGAIAIARTFFETLTGSDMPPLEGNIANRLALVPSVDSFFAPESISLPKRRWRKAIARVMLAKKQQRHVGGHTIPNNITADSHFNRAISRNHRVRSDRRTTNSILATCRREGVTFGHAIHVLCQVAHAAVLQSQYHKDDISDKEWEHRIRQPMHFMGAMNIRPYLDKEWLRKGGGNEPLATGMVFECSLPIMPTCSSRSDGELMSRERFIHRCLATKQKMDSYLKHPLLLEFAALFEERHREDRFKFAMLWRAMQDSKLKAEEDKASSQPKSDAKETGMDIGSGGATYANMISSLGSIDAALPPVYPRSKADVEPILKIIDYFPGPRPFPGQFYLSSVVHNGVLQLTAFWDAGVYNDALMIEWANLVGKSAVQYLGGGPPLSQEVEARL